MSDGGEQENQRHEEDSQNWLRPPMSEGGE